MSNSDSASDVVAPRDEHQGPATTTSKDSKSTSQPFDEDLACLDSSYEAAPAAAVATSSTDSRDGEEELDSAAVAKPKRQRPRQLVIGTYEQSHCSICLENYTKSNPAAVYACGHAFHIQCAEWWRTKCDDCAVCHQEIHGDSLPDPVMIGSPADVVQGTAVGGEDRLNSNFFVVRTESATSLDSGNLSSNEGQSGRVHAAVEMTSPLAVRPSDSIQRFHNESSGRHSASASNPRRASIGVSASPHHHDDHTDTSDERTALNPERRTVRGGGDAAVAAASSGDGRRGGGRNGRGAAASTNTTASTKKKGFWRKICFCC